MLARWARIDSAGALPERFAAETGALNFQRAVRVTGATGNMATSDYLRGHGTPAGARAWFESSGMRGHFQQESWGACGELPSCGYPLLQNGEICRCELFRIVYAEVGEEEAQPTPVAAPGNKARWYEALFSCWL